MAQITSRLLNLSEGEIPIVPPGVVGEFEKSKNGIICIRFMFRRNREFSVLFLWNSEKRSICCPVASRYKMSAEWKC